MVLAVQMESHRTRRGATGSIMAQMVFRHSGNLSILCNK
jgi:hypothetical protein